MDPDITHHDYAGARHELLYETEDVRADLMRRMDDFLGGLQDQAETKVADELSVAGRRHRRYPL